MFWNIRKIETLPITLVTRLNKVISTCDISLLNIYVRSYVIFQTKEKLLDLERKLNEVKLQADIPLTEQVLVSYRDEIQTTAKRMYLGIG